MFLNVFKFSSYEKLLVSFEEWLFKFSTNLEVLRPPESEKTFFAKVSVVTVVFCKHHNFGKNYWIQLRFGTFFKGWIRKDELVNQPFSINGSGFTQQKRFYKNQKFDFPAKKRDTKKMLGNNIVRFKKI